MDVVKAAVGATVIAFGLLLSSCAPQKTASSVMTSSSAAECVGQASENRFIVQWEDGSFSVEQGTSKDDFRDTFVTDNLQLIRHVDVDRRIQLPDQNTLRVNAASDVQASSSGSLNWGPAMIQASALWTKNIKGDGIPVAVIDGMVDVTNNQLRPNISVNPNEIANNGIDDDNNGFIDDVYGVQINVGTNNPSLNKHGSHVAGIIAADPNYGAVQGVAPRAKIIPAQFIDNDGGGSVGDAIIAMNYAATRGAKIMNMSWGGSPCVPNLQSAMKALSDQGILLITAAGNGNAYGIGENVDTTPSYPSAFNLLNQINVAASSIDDFMPSFSNYGAKSVHVAAPGVEIYSTVPGNLVESMSGTSMASPMTAGAAALLWSAFPSASAQQVKQALLKGVDITAGHEFAVSSRGRINVNKSYTILKSMLGL